MTKIITANDGSEFLVDDELYDVLAAVRWHVHTKGYAMGIVDGKRVAMHRWIMRAIAADIIDHADGNTRNNQTANLRRATPSQSQWNKNKYKRGKSQYKGVHWYARTSKWTAQIHVNNHKHHLGFYSDERDAALAYNKAARELHGEFAKLNDIDGQLEMFDAVKAKL